MNKTFLSKIALPSQPGDSNPKGQLQLLGERHVPPFGHSVDPEQSA